ncbi:hypothetical protein BVC80_453g1 [Macleaya cordata]|uniref:Uncharacterized protein n=1 Tax=Macleaya cordata TaxID=56857 RepID=A0A200Q0J9_MACCD|nr:hypothetical protein BVC80_453g1 [Macleaya cordata]
MEKKVDDGGGGVDGYWWWALASSAQMAAGIASYKRGKNGDSRFMPFKAFSVASLFVGAGATAVAGLINAAGIHKVEDLKQLGANVRTGLGVRPRETK